MPLNSNVFYVIVGKVNSGGSRKRKGLYVGTYLSQPLFRTWARFHRCRIWSLFSFPPEKPPWWTIRSNCGVFGGPWSSIRLNWWCVRPSQKNCSQWCSLSLWGNGWGSSSFNFTFLLHLCIIPCFQPSLSSFFFFFLLSFHTSLCYLLLSLSSVIPPSILPILAHNSLNKHDHKHSLVSLSSLL